MTRSISSPTLTQASAGGAKVGWLLQINWPTPVYLCSYGTITWNSISWIGASLRLDGFDASGKPQRLSIIDADAAYRTLVLTYGLRDVTIKLWKVYPDALGASDPILLFSGCGDGVSVETGRVSFALDWGTTRQQFTPRDRIGPGIGVNFVATPGSRVSWNGQTLIIEERS